MSYIVLARKYRPQTFKEVVGQPHITTTLENAIAQDRVAHAYLFAGPRGIGKTTTARIFAKALNCEKGPTTQPCNKCASCVEITQGTSLDILEIDGASNRGIDEIRNLRDNIKFAPSKGRCKVYIIDEVHMLTQEAFNALLKTLEEPPPHVKFIFATTQAYKIPATILSRCQRFDFRRISTNDILENLKRISGTEKLNVKDEVLMLIAKYADGSMRDGEVILDQITSFAKGDVELEDVVKILGMVDEEMLFNLSGSIKEKDAVKALKTIDKLINDGKDVVQVLASLIEHFRNLAITKISKDLNSLLDVSSESLKRFEEEGRRFSIEEILYVIYTLSGAIDLARKSSLARVPFETAMIKLTKMGPVASLGDIIKKVASLEERLGPNRNDRPAQTVVKNDPPVQEPVKQPAQTVTHHSGNLDEIKGSWNLILNQIKSKKMFLALYLQEGYPVEMDKGNVSIGFPKSSNFHKETLENPEYRKLIEDSVKEVTGADTRVKFVISETVQVPAINSASPSQPSQAEDEAFIEDPGDGSQTAQPKDVEPIIKDAMNIFGGTIQDSKKGKAK